MNFRILSIFPRILDSYIKESLMKRALQKGIISIDTYDIRNFTTDKHHKVDDRPFGGGPGMVLKLEPIYRCIAHIAKRTSKQRRIILFSTRGKKLDGKIAKRLSKYDELILICGRYEGVDERVADYIADEEISIGDYVLSGGELPAMVLIESVSRYLPGFLGKHDSLEDVKGSYPTYTKPYEFRPTGKRKVIWSVPKVLRSGSHEKIRQWRKER